MNDHHGSAHRTPRWVKLAGIIVVVLLLLFSSLHLIGRSFLGHALGGHGSQALPSSATEHERHQP
jgi:hypothetical protein